MNPADLISSNYDGTYSAPDGSVFADYNEAYAYTSNLILSGVVGSTVGPAQVADPNAPSGIQTILDNPVSPVLSPTNTVAAGTSGDAWSFLGSLLNTTAQTAGTIINQGLTNEVQLAAAKTNQQLVNKVNQITGATTVKTTTPTTSSTAIMLFAAFVGVVLFAGYRASRKAA